jgi:hypothetical protein
VKAFLALGKFDMTAIIPPDVRSRPSGPVADGGGRVD